MFWLLCIDYSPMKNKTRTTVAGALQAIAERCRRMPASFSGYHQPPNSHHRMFDSLMLSTMTMTMLLLVVADTKRSRRYRTRCIGPSVVAVGTGERYRRDRHPTTATNRSDPADATLSLVMVMKKRMMLLVNRRTIVRSSSSVRCRRSPTTGRYWW